MPKIKERVIKSLTLEMQMLRYENRGYMDWVKCKSVIENRILPIVFDVVEEEFKLLKDENSKLVSTINKLSFKNDPIRDKLIIELFDEGMSRGEISKRTGMSKWGVSKALRRLGVN